MTQDDYVFLANRFHQLTPEQQQQVLKVTELLLHGTPAQREILAEMVDAGLPWAEVWSLLERSGHA